MGVGHRDDLAGGRAVAAGIGGAPGTGEDVEDGTCSCCAYFAEDSAPAAVDGALRACVSARADGPPMARRAYEVVRREHEMGAVTAHLYEFLRRIASEMPAVK